MAEKICFYRTQDKKEIDFIIDGKPVELKTAYNGSKLTALDYFKENYDKQGSVITLHKKPNINYHVMYPWEMQFQ